MMLKNPIVQGMIGSVANKAIKGVSGALKGLFRKGRGRKGKGYRLPGQR